MPEIQDLMTLLRSRVPLVVVESREEARVLTLFRRAAAKMGRPLSTWNAAEGLRRFGRAEVPGAAPPEGQEQMKQGLQDELAAQRFRQQREEEGRGEPLEPDAVLRRIWQKRAPGLYVLVDFHPYLADDPVNVRLVKQIAMQAHESDQTLALLSHRLDVPEEVEHLAARFDAKLPDRPMLNNIVGRVARRWQREHGERLHVDDDAVEQIVQNLRGLTMTSAARLARSVIYDDGALTRSDVPEVAKAKHRLLSRDAVLSFEYDTAGLGDVGGLARLKEWLRQREPAFKGEADGLEPPRGVMLLGVQGSGKSLAAKAVAGAWGVPLLRMDFGALYDKYFGETERKTREALSTAATMAPCVLWMDEIEKGLATGRGGSEQGTSQRLLGTLLTWMAEREAPVFLVATANDVEQLPPELLRKGRFDETFFVDLPGLDVRAHIFDIHLRRRDLDPAGFDTARLAEAASGFSGAEIEQAVVSGLYSAQQAPGDLSEALLLEEIRSTQPLSVVMREKIDRLRSWAAERTVPAH